MANDKLSRRDALKTTAGVVGLIVTSNGDAVSAQNQASDQPTPIPATQQTQQKRPQLLEERPIESAPDPELGDGKTPFTRGNPDEDKWREIVSRVKTMYHIDTERGITAALDEMFQPIHHGIDLSTVVTAGGFVVTDEFKSTHVESLLDQAADLLERALRTRYEWNETAARAFEVGLDIFEYAEIDKIHQEEIEEGFYTVDYQQSYAEHEAQKKTTQILGTAFGKLQELINNEFSENKKQKLTDSAHNSAYYSVVPNYWFEVPEGMRNAERLEDIRNQISHRVLNQRSSKGTILGNAAREISEHDFATVKSSLEERKDEVFAAHWESGEKEKGTGAGAAWDKQNINFSRRRTEVARDLADLKSKAATAAGGVLNYAERMVPLKERFKRDFIDALARIGAAHDGLKKLYGYDDPPPPPNTVKLLKSPTGENLVMYPDECLIWVQDAISKVIRFSQHDQNYVLPVSVKGMIDNTKWESGLNSGTWEFEIPIAKSDADEATNLFPYQRSIRLRGLSAFVETGNAQGTWQLTVLAPSDSKYRYLKGEPVDVKQKVPPCRLGRVSSRESRREPDVVGITTLRNISPFGKWKLTISKVSTSGASSSEIKDIILDLHVAVRALDLPN